MPSGNKAPAKVCSKRCSTCIFTRASPVRPERIRDIMENLRINGGHQICHSFGVGSVDDTTGEDKLDGIDVWCRGFFDMLPDWMRRYFQHMGWIEFIDPPGPQKDIHASPSSA